MMQAEANAEAGTYERCAISTCKNDGVKDVLVPMVIDKQVATVEQTFEGRVWKVLTVVRSASGPMKVKKVLASMCPRHAPDWEPAPEV
ncbi:MAG: hypothetical protein JRN62_02980 [Nitrososphaerota archaeon]|jgi:hypothetical protein|nr:hypothetical protein [Nitrososphaerota archaeon]MDG6948958.1 hypothetical protein [Nitrososphaerota archaeon]